MIIVGSRIKCADNAGGLFLKCIMVFGGYKKRYAGLSELVNAVVAVKKSYIDIDNLQKEAKLAKKIKKKRKIKIKKKRQPNMRPYLALLTAIKKRTKRIDGSYLKFDENRLFTFHEPIKFGPAGKTENIPGLAGTKVFGPAPIELVINKKINDRFKTPIRLAGGII
jgi:ribosomal protein L14